MSRVIATTSSGKHVHDATHAAYKSRHRFPKWNIEPDALLEPRLLKRTLPGWTRADHEEAADAHDAVAENLEAQLDSDRDRADKKYGDGGNPYAWVAGGIREHWPRDVKDRFRAKTHKLQAHKDAARAHRAAMRFRS